jgi:phage terminase large subunit-like protein
VWTDGSAWDFENWASGEPNAGDSSEDYLLLGTDERFQDDPSSHTHAFVCKI